MKSNQQQTSHPANAGARILLIAALAFWLGLPSLLAQAVPGRINYQGILLSGLGAPITVPTAIQFRIWDTPTGTDTNGIKWGRSFTVTPDTSGAFNVVLSDEGALVSDAPSATLYSVFTSVGSDSRFLELTVAGSTAIRPRQQFVASPYAMLAHDLTPRQDFAVGGELTVVGAANVGSLYTPAGVTANIVSAPTVRATLLSATNAAIGGLTVSGAASVSGAVTAGSFVGNGVGLTNINTNNLVQQVVEALCPPGTIVAFGGTTVPSGWMLCDGASVSRTTYVRLYAAIGTAWGNSAGGTSSFNVPDLRGYFLRGRDGGIGRDPNRTTRSALYTGGATADNVGSFQSFAMQNVTGVVGQWNGFSGLGANVSSGPFYEAEDVISGQGGPGGYSDPHDKISFDLSRSAQTSTETRPMNANVNYIIKY